MNEKLDMSSAENNQDPTPAATKKILTSSSSTTKLRKIPGIPIQRSWREPAEKSDDSRSSGDGDGDGYEVEEDVGDYGLGRFAYGKSEPLELNVSQDDDSIILASTLGLNRIRTRSSPLPSPLRCSSSSRNPSNIGDVGSKKGNVANKEKLRAGVEACTSQLPNLNPIHQGTHHFFLSLCRITLFTSLIFSLLLFFLSFFFVFIITLNFNVSLDSC